MKWYAIVDAVSGRAVSFATDAPGNIATPLPTGLMLVLIDHQPSIGERWDPIARAVVVIPVAAADPLRAVYAVAVTDSAKLDVIAQKLGLK